MDPDDERRTLDRVIAEHRLALMELPGVVGIGAGEHDGRAVIEVLVDRGVSIDQLPSTLEGYAVHVKHTGEIGAR